MISAVVLNWKRPENIGLIISALRKFSQCNEIIIWNNNGTAPIECEQATVINAGKNFGCDARYAIGMMASNEHILFQDDDLIVDAVHLQAMYESLQAEPNIIHGLFGRRPKANGSYADFVDCQDARVPVIAGRISMFRRDYLPMFFQAAMNPTIRAVREEALKLGLSTTAGDDILMSFLPLWTCDSFNRVHPFPYRNLATRRGALCDHPQHIASRDKVFQLLQTLSWQEILPKWNL